MDRRTYLRTLGGASALGAGSIGVAAGSVDEYVETERGPVEGEPDGDVIAYKGIPYAAQPVGERRFRPPERPAPAWGDELDGSEYGPRAPQPLLATNFVGLDATTFVGEEDGCLNLNVWAPEGADEGEKAVMFWIHGGAYIFGSNRFPGGELAEDGDVVVVAPNYRLNALGFFAHPAVTAENPDAPTNVGYLDIRAALEWVQQNVARFGGDPDNVTVFGESAGGHAVLTLLTDPDAEGLFHRAISQSGPINEPLYSLSELESRGEDAAAELSCGGSDALACLREADPSDLASAYGVAQSFAGMGDPSDGPRVLRPGLVFGVDGEVVESHPATRIAEGEFHDVPVLLGGNAEEYQFFLAFTGDAAPESASAYRQRVRAEYGQFADDVLEQYPASDYDSIEEAYVDLFTDDLFLCSDYKVAREIEQHGGTAYRYVFDDKPTVPVTLTVEDPGAYHTAELSYVFGQTVTQQGLPTGILGPQDYRLRHRMQTYWTNFAKRGDPNGSGWFAPPEWPAVGDDLTRVRLQARSVDPESGVEPECELFAEIYEYVRSEGR